MGVPHRLSNIIQRHFQPPTLDSVRSRNHTSKTLAKLKQFFVVIRLRFVMRSVIEPLPLRRTSGFNAIRFTRHVKPGAGLAQSPGPDECARPQAQSADWLTIQCKRSPNEAAEFYGPRQSAPSMSLARWATSTSASEIFNPIRRSLLFRPNACIGPVRGSL